MPIVYLALGSNLGDRAAHLRAAIAALAPAVRVLKESAIYETPPWGYTAQPPFLNMALKAETSLPPLDLLAHLKDIERRLGRVETFRNGPRAIDLDILLYDLLVFEQDGLSIPHPRLHERAFVLVPLADVGADAIHPLLGEFVWQLLFRVDVSGICPYAES